MTNVALSVNSGNCINSVQTLQGKFHIKYTALPSARSLRGASYDNQDPVKRKQFTTTYFACPEKKRSSRRVTRSYLVSNCMKIKPGTFNGESVSIASLINQDSPCTYVLQYKAWIRKDIANPVN